MRAIRVMGIIGIVWSAICFLCIMICQVACNVEATAGWGYFSVFFMLPLSIVAVVQGAKIDKGGK